MRAWEGLKVCQNVVRGSPGCAMVLECGLGTFAQRALCTVPSSPGSHLRASPDPKFWQKRTQKLWYTAGWESRSVGWVTGVDARATGTRRLRGDDARASMPPHAHRGGVPVFLMQLSSTDDCTCPLAPRGHAGQALSHTRLCASHRACAAAAIGNDHPLCTIQWMQRSRNHSQSLWRPACRPHSTHNHKPWEQFCTHVTNHGLYTGCNLNPNHGLLQGMQFAPRIQTMVL
jgi:hypothetical protein